MRGAEDPSLRIVHGAILGSLLVFGVLAVALGPAEPSPLPGVAQWSWLFFVLAAVFAVGALRGRLAAERDPEKRRQGAILLWATAEGAGLASLAFVFISGVWTPLLGAAVAVALLLVHGPRALAGGGR